jgi:hypothetical protein
MTRDEVIAQMQELTLLGRLPELADVRDAASRLGLGGGPHGESRDHHLRFPSSTERTRTGACQGAP